MLALFVLLWGMAAVGLLIALLKATRAPQQAGPAAGQKPAQPHPRPDALNGISPHGELRNGIPQRGV
jgi:hypothetical protein